MYAVVECGGRQYQVEPGTHLTVNHLNADAGAEIVLDRVLLVGGEDFVKVGTPIVEGARVVCKVLKQGKGPKVNGFTFKAKKNQYRHYGHRQAVTVLSVESIE